MILILEDNEQRIEHFKRACAEIAPDRAVRIWHSAVVMQMELVDVLELATLISLDHDLMPQPGATDDPGTGYEIACFLAELHPACPVIVHTSNGDRGNWMSAALTGAGWKVKRVYPFEDEWIQNDWMPVARRLLLKKV